MKLDKTLADSEIYPNEVENIENLLSEAKLHNLKNANINRFANLGFPENEVTITTRHSSKGLEFEAVILLGMEEGHFPNYYHLDNPIALVEDQRLCYVCISRISRPSPREIEDFNPVNHFDNIGTITKNLDYPLYTTTFCPRLSNLDNPIYVVEIKSYTSSLLYFIHLKVIDDKIKLEPGEMLFDGAKIDYRRYLKFNE